MKLYNKKYFPRFVLAFLKDLGETFKTYVNIKAKCI